jgi:hypothetical protein
MAVERDGTFYEGRDNGKFERVSLFCLLAVHMLSEIPNPDCQFFEPSQVRRPDLVVVHVPTLSHRAIYIFDLSVVHNKSLEFNGHGIHRFDNYLFHIFGSVYIIKMSNLG